MSKILIDTNIYSHAMLGEEIVISVMRQAAVIGISAISIGELLSGFKGDKREKENQAELKEFLDSSRVRILPIDEETAEFYAEIINQLRRDGKPIPTNDIWIGAIALQHGLRMFTRDKHFKHIAGLLQIT